ncbi:MAG: L-lactate dehydrogenase [Lachnospiraceae bacterium]|nr:L-lactate dehydrogenase [Lachnospiraceae bacterium]
MKTVDVRKVILVGCGMVGMSYAYAMLNQGTCDELGLIDYVAEKAEGEAMDLNHSLAYSNGHMKIWHASYEDCADADVVTICAGVPQKPGQSRRDLLAVNTGVFKSIVEPVLASGFNGVFLIASNPVDVMTEIVHRLADNYLASVGREPIDPNRIVGSGTTLDSARLRYMLGSFLDVDPRNIHAYVIGEHGDSEFVPWSQANVATKPILEYCDESDGKYPIDRFEDIEEEVRTAAYKIIQAKRATYYGIGMSLNRLTKAILSNEYSIHTVSTWLTGQYGQSGLYVGLPSVIGANGVVRTLTLSLNEQEKAKFEKSCDILRGMLEELD